MKQYCPTCGSGTEYSLQKPKFCGSCGSLFGSMGQSTTPKVFKTNSLKITKDSVIEEEEKFSPPRINKLDFELEGQIGLSSHKIQDIAGSNPNALDDGYQREVDPSYSKDTIQQDFLRDAGSSRRDNADT